MHIYICMYKQIYTKIKTKKYKQQIITKNNTSEQTKPKAKLFCCDALVYVSFCSRGRRGVVTNNIEHLVGEGCLEPPK